MNWLIESDDEPDTPDDGLADGAVVPWRSMLEPLDGAEPVLLLPLDVSPPVDGEPTAPDDELPLVPAPVLLPVLPLPVPLVPELPGLPAAPLLPEPLAPPLAPAAPDAPPDAPEPPPAPPPA